MNIPNIFEVNTSILVQKWYNHYPITDDNSHIYIVEKVEWDKTLYWFYSAYWWFNSKTFGSSEYWFDSVITSESWWAVMLTLEKNDTTIMCDVEEGEITVEDSPLYDASDIIDQLIPNPHRSVN